MFIVASSEQLRENAISGTIVIFPPSVGNDRERGTSMPQVMNANRFILV